MMYLHLTGRTLRSVAAVLLAAVVLFASAPAVAPAVLAQGPAPKLPALGARADQLLARLYHREQTWLNAQTKHLERAGQAADKAQQLLDAAKEKGKDVAALETALGAFKADLAKAQAAHDEAAGILSTHAGFDGNGQVTDRQAARQTVVQARQSLGEAHRTLVKAVRNLRQAVRDWRRDHRPQAPAATK